VAGYNFGRLAPSRVVLHHTYRPDEAGWAGLRSMRAIQRFYAGKGWRAGPHIFTAPDGIWLATPMSQVGIHAGTGNGSARQGWYSIGLEMVGFFDGRVPAGPGWEHARAVMGELSRRLRIPPRQLISFHRDYTNVKSCPGWAVSKEWVWGQVEAYLSGTAAPAPQPQPAPPGAPDERLLEALLEQSFAARAGGQGYNPGWAFHEYARANALGNPLGPSATITVEGKQLNYQPFARDTLFCEVPNWGDVRLLSATLGGSIPPAGIGRALLEATYQAGGSPFRPDWAFHQFALLNRLGPPVGKSQLLNVDGQQYAYQAFAADTLYSPTSDYGDVRMLSRIAAAADAPTMRLRDALTAATYGAAGVSYHPDWAFHQLARRYAIGAPLSESYRLRVEGAEYALQVYALDTLFNLVPRWSEVRRLRDLALAQGAPLPGGAVLGGAATEEGPALPTGDHLPPTTGAFRVVEYSPQATAFSPRDGRRVEQVVLHGVAGPEDEALAQMTAPGARFATHYYVSTEGVIYRLVREGLAAWHAGAATADGRRLEINQSSIGVALERPAGWPAQPAGSTDAQLLALRWLLKQLDGRYGLTPQALVLWSSFAGSDDDALEGLPLAALREALG
jgi:hypothetical protein